MSTRQLRKLQKQRELEAQIVQEPKGSDDDADEDEIAPVVAKPRANLFAALGGEDEDEDEGDDDAHENPEQTSAVETPVEEPVATASSRKNKKKKKKGKAKKAAPAQEAEQSEDDEIDRAIKELKIEQKPQAGSVTSNAPTSQEIFKINLYNLKAINEMRNLFGRDTIESANAEEEEQRREARHGIMPEQVDLETFLRGPPNTRKLPEVSRRRNIFIQGREHWPMSTTGGLSLKEVGKTADGVEYAYAHAPEYDEIQALFFAQVQMGDPMRMVHLLTQFRKKPINPIIWKTMLTYMDSLPRLDATASE
ncbi:hypothetical protein THARTR1_00867 [Trichoderma harzianum]|uniref:Uncharacterized protein n=1 Tax=Trichoderma harzianum TaxID=5544 RepID=A0A2K0UNL3_TRIHA|nr:hypothetical protein THARTR1_00867 [Trichoderma harzianum]